MIRSWHFSYLESKVPDHKPHQEPAPALHEPWREEYRPLNIGEMRAAMFLLVQGRRETFESPSLTFMIHCWLPCIYLHQIQICLQMQWPGLFPFTAPCFPLSLENPKVGASQTPVNYCITGRSPGPPPSQSRACGIRQDLGTAPRCSSHCLHVWAVPRHSPWPLQSLLLPRAAYGDKGSSLDRRFPKGGHRKGPEGPQSRQVPVRLGASAFLASTSQTHSNISLFF